MNAMQERNGQTFDDRGELLDEVLSVTAQAMDAREGAFVEKQLQTAQRKPRSIKAFLDRATELACIDQETAAACSYSVPRGGKKLQGASIRLAEICVMAWGHLHCEARISEVSREYLIASATAWDMANNVRIGQDVRRNILTKTGQRFNEDMINVTANAAMSIAMRNAIFRVIPKALVETVRQKALATARGDEKTLKTRRDDLVKHFAKLGIDDKRILALLDKKGIEDIDLDDIVTLRGVATAIKDGEMSASDAFPDNKKAEASKTLLDKVKGEKPAEAAAEVAKPSEAKPEPANAMADAATVAAIRQEIIDLGFDDLALRTKHGVKKWEELTMDMACDVLKSLRGAPDEE